VFGVLLLLFSFGDKGTENLPVLTVPVH